MRNFQLKHFWLCASFVSGLAAGGFLVRNKAAEPAMGILDDKKSGSPPEKGNFVTVKFSSGDPYLKRGASIEELLALLVKLDTADFKSAQDLLRTYRSDPVFSTVIMDWMFKHDANKAIEILVDVFDHVTPQMQAIMGSFAAENPNEAWAIVKTKSDWRTRAFKTGIYDALLATASPIQIKEFLDNCDGGAFSSFLSQSVKHLAPEGELQQLGLCNEYLERAAARGIDISGAIASTYPELFERLRSRGSIDVQKAGDLLLGSTLAKNTKAMTEFAESYVKADPERAFQWIGKLPEETRNVSVSSAVATLAASDIDSAADLAFNGQLSPADRAIVMSQLLFASSGSDGNLEIFDKSISWLKANSVDISALESRITRPMPK